VTTVLPQASSKELPPPTVGRVTKLAAPTIAEQFIVAFIGVTDTWLAGHIPGDSKTVAAAAAAVGTMMYIQWFAGLMTSFIGTGAIAIVSRSIGARRIRVANRVAGTAVATAFLVGLFVAVSLFTFAGPFVRVVGLEGLAADFGKQYLQIMCVTLCFQSAAQIGMACLRGAGDTLRPMLIMALVSVVNLVASSVLTFGLFGLPAFGIRGNAAGTLLAFFTGGMITIYLLVSGRAGLKLRLNHLRVVPHVVARIGKIGIPSWLEGMLLWGGQFLIVVLVINAIGDKTVTMAAHGAVLRIESFSFLPGFGFGMAASALVGQYLGAKRPDQAMRAAHVANRLGLITMTVMALPMVFLPSLMIWLMVWSPEVISVGFWPMILAGLAQPGFAFAIVYGSALRGAGDTVSPMIATISGMILRIIIVLPAAYWLKAHNLSHYALTAVWIAIFIDLNYRAVFNTITFHRGKWQHKRV